MTRKVLLLFLICMAAQAWSDDEGQSPKPAEDLTKMSIEDLLNVEVTTASKKAQFLTDVPAAIYVITSEDIRRSGATSVPDLLRMVPGVQVAQIDANKWAISIRGFNGRYANKLLVLIDGRSVYTPLFSGVYWDVQDVMLEDVERIEVIRGPGGSLWGANAVNGIINIITKHAKDTQGSLLYLGVGDEEKGLGGFRHGGAWGKDGHYRVYGKFFKRDALISHTTGMTATDGWKMRRGEFRMDRGDPSSSQFTMQGEFYSGDVQQGTQRPTLTPPFSETLREDVRVSGGHLLARWQRRNAKGAETSLQVYYDRTRRNAPLELNEVRSTFDVDFQRRARWSERQDVVWGVGYRRTSDRTQGTFHLSFDPAHRTDDLFSAFIQNDVTLKENLRLSIGSKFEHNDYSGFEVQPNLRLLWQPNERRTLWASVARAVRTPSRADHDLRVNVGAGPGANGAPPNVITLFGDNGFESETVRAHEIGYRFRPHDNVSVDVAAFYNVYNNLRTFERGTPFLEMSPLPPHVVVPFMFANRLSAKTYGAEIATQWTVNPQWRVAAGYTLFKPKFRFDATSTDTLGLDDDLRDTNPHQQFHLRSHLNLSKKFELDTLLYGVDNIGSIGIKGYTRLDVRLGWRPKENVEVSLVGQNLLGDRSREFDSTLGEGTSRVERGIYGKVTWRF